MQHADNPVDWYPWGKEAFEKAEREDKPVFLSIGYSTCHWCHVMAHESFEDEEIAQILNQYFVAVKVDREERPDVDSVYMSVCQVLTGSGGWPMSIFMTPEQKPFYAGTYFPPSSRYGRMGFRDLLLAIEKQWKTNRKKLLESAEDILLYITPKNRETQENIDSHLPRKAAEIFARSFDVKHGGFGQAPKFPTPHNLIFLILYSFITHEDHAFLQVKVNLEKMLYDNALMILACAVAYKASGERLFLDTAEQTAEYIFREMTGSSGEFYSAQDADSDGEEGKFYVWGYEEIGTILGKEKGRKFCEYFGITKQGNFEGKNIPNLLNGNEISGEFEQERKALYEYRNTRTKLHLDDKVLTAWNSLMICAMAVLYRVTGKECYLSAAKKNQRFIEEHLVKGDLLYVSCRNNSPSVNGFLDDYAYYAAALICLYEANAGSEYLERAQQIMEEAERQFADPDGEGYFLYGTQNNRLITKPKETYDGALPAGNSVMAYCLVRLSQITGGKDYMEHAERQLAFLSGEAKEYPAGHSLFQTALLLYLHPSKKITAVISGEETEKVLTRLPLYADIRILLTPTEEYRLLNNRTTYYVCENHTCLPPSNELPKE